MVTSPALRALMTPGWVRDPLWTRAQRVPSLDLRFAANRSLRDAVTGRELVTFTRASSATVVGPTGLIETAANDVPRFQRDPATGACLGLLVEEQRANLVTYSEAIDDASWTKTAILNFGSGSVANAIAAPDGTTTADLVVPNTSSTSHSVQLASVTTSANSTSSLSFFAKAAGYSSVVIRYGSTTIANRGQATVSLATGAVTNTQNLGTATGATCTATAYPGGWYRISLSVNPNDGAASAVRVLIYPSSDSAYAGDGASGIYLWGAQIEAGAFPTSYIATTGTSATRSADIATITTLGSSIRSLFAHVRGPASGTRGIIGLDDNSANNRIELLASGTDPKLLVTTGGSAVADLDGGTVAANVEARLAARFDADNYAISVGGGAEVVDTAGALPAVDRVRIGALQAGNTFSGTIARLTAWDRVPPNLPTVSS